MEERKVKCVICRVKFIDQSKYHNRKYCTHQHFKEARRRQRREYYRRTGR